MDNNISRGLEMYFDPTIAKKFAALEQNEKNYAVAQAVDFVMEKEIKNNNDPLSVCELYAGAHPDRYEKLFERLMKKPQGNLDWVDISPVMLSLAKDYISDNKFEQRLSVLDFVEKDAIEYLKNLPDQKLDLACAKYALDFVSDLDQFFALLHSKLKVGGALVATIPMLDPKLKSISTNARFLFNGQEFPENATRTLQDGDVYTIKFFNISGDPSSGYLECAQTMKFFHSEEKILTLAKKYNFDFFLGDWKELTNSKEGIDQLVLVLRKID